MTEQRPDTEDVAAVTEANTAFYDAFEAGDLDRMDRLWVSEVDPVCIHPGAAPVIGAAELHRAWAVVMANTPYIQFVLTDVHVRVHDDVATLTCTENVLTPDAAPGEHGDGFSGGSAVASNVFLRSGQGWRLWVHHASPVASTVAP